MKFYSSFEQFELIVLQKLVWNQIDISITNLSIVLVLSIVFILCVLGLVNYNIRLIPIRYQVLAESIYEFIISLIKDQTGKKGIKYFPIIFILLMFLLTLNLLGLIPYSYTVTSQLIVTFVLSFSLFLGLILIGFKEQGIKFLKIFVPSGIPNWLLPLLFCIVMLMLSRISLAIGSKMGVFSAEYSTKSVGNIKFGPQQDIKIAKECSTAKVELDAAKTNNGQGHTIVCDEDNGELSTQGVFTTTPGSVHMRKFGSNNKLIKEREAQPELVTPNEIASKPGIYSKLNQYFLPHTHTVKFDKQKATQAGMYTEDSQQTKYANNHAATIDQISTNHKQDAEKSDTPPKSVNL